MSYIDIENVTYERREVGKTIKSTKILNIWSFILEKKYHRIELYDSRISGRKKLVLDGQTLTDIEKEKSHFHYSFKIDLHYFTVLRKSDDEFDCRIDNRQFFDIQRDERSGRFKKLKEKIENEKKEVKKRLNEEKKK